MAMLFSDRVKETTSVVGSGSITLNGATSGYFAFTAPYPQGIGAGNKTCVCVTDNAGNSEILEVTVVSGSPNSLTVGRVLASTNSNAKISWAAGVKDVFCFRPYTLGSTFKVTKTAVQSILAATNTALTWATEAWDLGSNFDTGTGRWTPAAGKVRLILRVGILNFTPTSPNTFYSYIYKNGATVAWHRNRLDTNLTINLAPVIYEDEASGTDYYDARVFGDSAFDVTNETNMTTFMGARIHG